MLKKALIALFVAIIVAIVCLVLAGLFILFKVELATSIGTFLKQYSTFIGILAGLAYFVWGPPKLT